MSLVVAWTPALVRSLAAGQVLGIGQPLVVMLSFGLSCSLVLVLSTVMVSLVVTWTHAVVRSFAPVWALVVGQLLVAGRWYRKAS